MAAPYLEAGAGGQALGRGGRICRLVAATTWRGVCGLGTYGAAPGFSAVSAWAAHSSLRRGQMAYYPRVYWSVGGTSYAVIAHVVGVC